MSNYGNSIPAIIRELQILNGSDEEYSNSKYGIIDALVDVRENVKELNNAIDNINGATPENNQTLSGIGDKILETGEQIVAINAALDGKIGQTTPDDPTLDGIATRIALLPTGGVTTEMVWSNGSPSTNFAQQTLHEGTDFELDSTKNLLGYNVYFQSTVSSVLYKRGIYIPAGGTSNVGGQMVFDQIDAFYRRSVGASTVNGIRQIQFSSAFSGSTAQTGAILVPTLIEAVYA